MTARTPSQTIGPFFHEALRWPEAGRVTFAESGTRIVLVGRVIDGSGAPVADALIETWQLSPEGEAPRAAGGDARPNGFGRVETEKDGTFCIETLMPGARAGGAPCIEVAIFARGLLKALRTRAYLADESRVRADPAMEPLAQSPRLKTLLATQVSAHEFRWDIRLQGEGETVFFGA
jgi:protocatechuate 3,4-dioxygenase alpha subunit